jgi:hypothetical protein
VASNKKQGKKQNQPSGLRWLFGEIFSLVRQFGHSFIWALVVCFLIFEGAHTFQAFAGKVSIADLALEIATHINVTVALSLTLSGVTTALWANECRRHKNTRVRLTARKAELEKRLDKNRESSLLTPEGTTREGDQ